MLTDLLRRGRSATVKGFKSKQGRTFEAALTWSAQEKRVVFSFDDVASDRRAPEATVDRPRASKAARVRAAPLGVGDACPRCGQGRLMRGRLQLGCDRYQAGCDFRAPLPDEVGG
jgi:DNA topoisomerase-3